MFGNTQREECSRVKPGACPAADREALRPNRERMVVDEAPPAKARRLGKYRGADSSVSIRNIHMMHVLERIAARFNDADIPLLVLKGAALNLTLYDRPDKRPMGDLDLLIRPEHIDESFALLETLGCLRGEPLVREDFFPRFYYEAEYSTGSIFPVKIDLHVRPFRPLRYSRLVPVDALWQRAEPVRIGRAMVLIPSAEDMLIHLAAHSAIHGNSRAVWLQDIKHWADAYREVIDWDRLLATAKAWHLAPAVQAAVKRAERDFGPVCPPEIRERLFQLRGDWRDRLALYQAPRDADHPVAHVLVNVLCTPGWRFALAYLRAVLVPDRGHMDEWYCRRHWGWLAWAYLLRWLWPVAKHVRPLWTLFSKVETRKSGIHGIGVFATRDIKAGELIARYSGKEVDRDGLYVVRHKDPSGDTRRYEITGKLKFLNHCCQPNAELTGFNLVAIKSIRAGQEITIDYGEGTCTCKRDGRRRENPPAAVTLADVA